MESFEGKMPDTQRSNSVSTRQERIAELARRKPEEAITTLAHHIDIEWMKEAHRRTRKDGAAGVDETTAQQYGEKLEENLKNLLDRAKDGDRYRAPPVRRVHIPKGDGGSTRPIGIPTFEDKVLQRAVTMAVEAIYEQDFYDCSFGFRPGKSAHDALESFRSQMMSMKGGWVVEVDIKQFFDTIDHALLQEVVRKRVRDGVVLRLIGKWLNAGVMEAGSVSYPEAGTPQGGVVSPLLANIYLHEVLDTWFHREVLPRMKGRVFLVRYADDFVIGCSREADARVVLGALPKRFGKYGLTLHPEKTRLVAFERPRQRKLEGASMPGSFDFLGFTHHWALSLKGNWVIKLRTAKGRFRRALQSIAQWCRANRHRPMKEQHRVLSQKLRGHCNYYGITGNSVALDRFRNRMRDTWKKWLSRRSDRPISWVRFEQLGLLFELPAAIAVRSKLRRVANP